MPFLFQKDAERLVCGFISSRLDGCTIWPTKTKNYQSTIRNASPHQYHITPVLRSLHWLPVSARIDFKILSLVYSFLRYTPSRSLRPTGRALGSPWSRGFLLLIFSTCLFHLQRSFTSQMSGTWQHCWETAKYLFGCASHPNTEIKLAKN